MPCLHIALSFSPCYNMLPSNASVYAKLRICCVWVWSVTLRQLSVGECSRSGAELAGMREWVLECVGWQQRIGHTAGHWTHSWCNVSGMVKHPGTYCHTDWSHMKQNIVVVLYDALLNKTAVNDMKLSIVEFMFILMLLCLCVCFLFNIHWLLEFLPQAKTMYQI